MSADPVHAFEHDHAELNRLVRDLGALVQELEHRAGVAALGPQVAERLVALRDDLFMHFVREEEGLFPYVASTVPELADAVADLIVMHDEICGTVARMVYVAQTVTHPEVLVPLFRRFESAHARHAQSERALLSRVGEHLTAEQRLQLAELVRGL